MIVKKPKFVICEACKGRGQTKSKRSIVTPGRPVQSVTIYVQCSCCGGIGEVLEAKQ